MSTRDQNVAVGQKVWSMLTDGLQRRLGDGDGREIQAEAREMKELALQGK